MNMLKKQIWFIIFLQVTATGGKDWQLIRHKWHIVLNPNRENYLKKQKLKSLWEKLV